MDPGREYVRLALRLDRLAPGTVAGYIGDPALRAAVRTEAPAEPRAIAAAARSLRGRLAELPPSRRALLDAGLTALAHAAATLGGMRGGHRAEAVAYFQLAPGYGDVDDYRAAHRELAALLPGDGPFAERLHARTVIPPAALPACTAALSAALAERARQAFRLPADERVHYRFGPLPVTGSHRYLGGHVSVVHLDDSRPHTAASLARAVAHEAYPGHHTEQCLANDPFPEHTVHCPNTPRAAITEGAAELGLDVLCGPGWGNRLTAVLAEAGVRVDGELAEAVAAVRDRLRPVRQDAALLLHERRRDPAEVCAYLERWALASPGSARAAVAFLCDPLRRCQATAYVGGRALVRRWLRTQSDPLAGYRRLLVEPVLPTTLAGQPLVNLSETYEPGARFE